MLQIEWTIQYGRLATKSGQNVAKTSSRPNNLRRQNIENQAR